MVKRRGKEERVELNVPIKIVDFLVGRLGPASSLISWTIFMRETMVGAAVQLGFLRLN